MDHTENSTKPMEAYAEEGVSANTEETVSAAAEEGISANTEETVSEAAQEEEYVSDDTLAAAMEAILFAMGDAVSLDLLAQALRISPERTETIAGLLAARCAGKKVYIIYFLIKEAFKAFLYVFAFKLVIFTHVFSLISCFVNVSSFAIE